MPRTRRKGLIRGETAGGRRLGWKQVVTTRPYASRPWFYAEVLSRNTCSGVPSAVATLTRPMPGPHYEVIGK